MTVQKNSLGKKKNSPTVSRRIKNPELLRKKQLHIAKKSAKLFIKKGYHQTTMREISKATGMAIGNLYGYISKKEDVLCLTFDVYHQYGQEILDKKEGADTKNTEELLKLFIHRGLQIVREFRDEMILMYRESRLLPRKELQKAKKRELEQIQTLERIIKRGIEQGVLRAQDPFFAASMIYYQLIFLIMRGWLFSGKYSEEEVETLLKDYIISPLIIQK